MTTGWKIRRIGEICDILDSRRKPVTKSKRQAGNIPYYGATGIQDYVNDYIFDGRYLLVGEDGAKWGKNDNTAYIIEGKSWVNNHAHVLRVHDDMIDCYVRYYLNGRDLNPYITGAIVPKLTQAALVSIPVPVPPLAEQERIVSELDLLSGIIDKQKVQLKELDNLAQSIFYDMFGDPVENEKGWEVKMLFEECEEITDGDHSAPPKTDMGIPFITISNIDKERNKIDFTNTFFVPQSYYENLKGNRKPRKGDVLYTVTGSYGITILIDEDKTFCFQRHIGLIRPKSTLNPVFLACWGRTKSIKKHADLVATGIAQKTVSLSLLRKFPLILPSLELQNSFAEKIERIEKQKEAITRSIVETQQLFDSRMAYWFN